MVAHDESQRVHRWYARPVLFVGDIHRALHFYTEELGFTRDWHSDEGKGNVCQVHRSDCEIILCEDATRRDQGRLFIELTRDGFVALHGELAARSIAHSTIRWGYDTTRVQDPDGNELFFPDPG